MRVGCVHLDDVPNEHAEAYNRSRTQSKAQGIQILQPVAEQVELCIQEVVKLWARVQVLCEAAKGEVELLFILVLFLLVMELAQLF